MKTRLILILEFLLLFYPGLSLLSLENNFNWTLNPSPIEDRGVGVSVVVENNSYVILAESKNNGYDDTALIIKLFPNGTEKWRYEKLIGGSGEGWQNDPFHLIKDKEGNIWWCGETYQNGWEGGFYLEKLSPNGKKLCSYQWESSSSPADEFVFMREYDNKIFVTGRKSSHQGIIYVFDKNCNLLDQIEHDIGCAYNEEILSIIKLKENKFLVSQFCYKYSHYLVRIYLFDYFFHEWKFINEFENLIQKNGYEDQYNFLFTQNLFTAGGMNYPSRNVSLFAYYSNLSLAYLHTYPFKGTLHRGALGWQKGTVIYAGDNGFTAYLFNATNGKLLAFYNSSLNHKAYALDIKRDFIPGCYVLIGAEQINNNDWQIRMERICEETQKPIANFSFSTKGLKVIFNSTSFSPNGKIVKYFWNFGDGSYSSEKNPVHYYKASGKYKVMLLVEDEKGRKETVSKEIEVKSKITKINFPQVVKINKQFEIKAEFSQPVSGKIVFANQTKFFNNLQNLKINFIAPNKENKYKIKIFLTNEEAEFPIIILSEKRYQAYLSLLEEKYLLERKLYEMANKLAEETINFSVEYLGDVIDKAIDKFKEALRKGLNKELLKFSEKIKEKNPTMSKAIENNANEMAENTANFVVEKIAEYGENQIDFMLTQAIYNFLLLPQIKNYQINFTYVLNENPEKIIERSEKAKEYIITLEKQPIYNLSVFGFYSAPNFEFFVNRTYLALETSFEELIANPFLLKKLVTADVQSILNFGVPLGYIKPREFHINFAFVPLLIWAAKMYIEFCEAVKKISPPLLLLGSYTSAYISASNLAPSALTQTGFHIMQANNYQIAINISKSFVQKGEKVNITITGFSPQLQNLLAFVSLNYTAEKIYPKVVENNFKLNFSFSPKEAGSYLVKACIFSGEKEIVCDAKKIISERETPIAAFIRKNVKIFAKNLYSKKEKYLLKCMNREEKIELEPNEEKEVNDCYGEAKIYFNSTLLDKTFLPEKSISLPNCSIVKTNGKINVTCEKENNIRIISPSGIEIKRKSRAIETNLNETGTWEIKICNSKICKERFVVNGKESSLNIIKGKGYVKVVNEYSRPVGGVKVICANAVVFTNESGIAKINTSICNNIFAEKPYYNQEIFHKSKSEKRKEFEIESCNASFISVKQIPADSLYPERGVKPVMVFSVKLSNGVCKIKFNVSSDLYPVNTRNWRKIGEKGEREFVFNSNSTIAFSYLPELKGSYTCKGLFIEFNAFNSGNADANTKVCFSDICKQIELKKQDEKTIVFPILSKGKILIDPENEVEEENETNNAIDVSKCFTNIKFSRNSIMFISPNEKIMLKYFDQKILFEKITPIYKFSIEISPEKIKEYYFSVTCRYEKIISSSYSQEKFSGCNSIDKEAIRNEETNYREIFKYLN